MQVFKSPNIDTIIADYYVKDTRYRVVSPLVFFRLSDGEVQKPEECIDKIINLYPNTIIDEGLPKIYGEWQIVGDVHRTKGKDHTLVKVVVGNSKKSVLADFSNYSKENIQKFSLQDKKYINNLFTYEETLSGIRKDLKSNFINLAMDDENRMALWGKSPSKRIGGFPDDFDYEYCSVAPKDQRISGSWKGDEEYEIYGVVPDEFDNYYHGKLPNPNVLVMGVFYDKKEGTTAKLNIDTIKLYPECNIGVMIFRGLFEIQSNQEIDLMMVINQSDYMRSDGNFEKDNQYFLEMGIDILKPKDPENAPIHQIKEKIKEIKKKSRKVVINRYCDVFNEYYDFEYTFDGLPKLMPLSNSMLSEDENATIKQRIADSRNLFSEKGLDWDELAKYNPDVKYLENQEPLISERNFNRQVSNIIFEKKNYVNEKGFVSLMNPRDLTNYSKNRFMLAYIDKDLSQKSVEWGIDNPSNFVIPKGILIPDFFGDTFTSAYVFPNGLYDDKNYYVIPGSEVTTYPSWHNNINENYCCCFLVDNLLDGLLLNEESYHYLNIAVVPEPSSEIPELTKKLIESSDFIIIPSPSDRVEETYSKWKDFAQRVQIVPLGSNDQDEKYNTLREFLLDDNSSVASWLQPYYPFAITDPQHLSVTEYAAAFDNLYSKLTGVKPNTFDTLSRSKEIIEEKRKEVLDVCNTEKEKVIVNQKFDEALANLEEDSKLNEVEMVQKAAKMQKENIINNAPLATFGGKATLSRENIEEALKCVDTSVDDFIKNHKKAEKHAKEIIEHLNSLQSSSSGSEEELAKRVNMTDKEIAYLKVSDVKSLSDIYITDRKWIALDLSEMNFANSVFDGVDFSESNLNFASFDNCTFINCTFNHNHMTNLKLKDCTYTDCLFANSLVGGCDWNNCHFDFCTFDGFKVLKGFVNNFVVVSSKFISCEITKIKLENANFSFTTFSDTLFFNVWFSKTQFTSCELDNNSFMEVHGIKLIFSYSKLKNPNFSKAVLDSLEFDHCDLTKIITKQSLWKNLTIESCQMEYCDLSSNVLENTFIRNSDLSYGFFKYIVAKEATFTNSVIRFADFFHADLLRSDFSKSKLGGTSFCEANLFEADFSETALEKNNFDNTDLRRTIISFMSTRRLF